MIKECDHTSVGMLVYRDGRLLLIERRRPPYGFAPPAGHVDGHGSFEEAAQSELREEVGLRAVRLRLVGEGKKNNPCRRKNGTWHYWKVYAATTFGDVKPSATETKRVGWYDYDAVANLARRTEKYLHGEINDNEWERCPGLEPVWYEWLVQFGMVSSSDCKGDGGEE